MDPPIPLGFCLFEETPFPSFAPKKLEDHPRSKVSKVAKIQTLKKIWHPVSYKKSLYLLQKSAHLKYSAGENISK